MGECDPSKVVCSGDGLVFGFINHPIRAHIDTTRAGPGEERAPQPWPPQPPRSPLIDDVFVTFIGLF